EAPLVRYVKIRQASTDTLDKRPVASLTVRLGKMTEVAEFTLNDRTHMTYPILLGREFLRDVAVVDVAKDNNQPKPEIVKNQPQAPSVSKSKKK
ncbi:RimK/LysX family protein, partial [Methylophaga sp. UBA3996]